MGTATKECVDKWIKKAKRKEATHLIIFWDRWDNWPYYVMKHENADEIKNEITKKENVSVDDFIVIDHNHL